MRRTTYDAIRAAAMVSGFPYANIREGGTKTGELFDTRVAVVLVAREHLGRSFETIGIALNRDHSTMVTQLAAHRHREEVQDLARQIIDILALPTSVERYVSARRLVLVPSYA